MNNRTTVFALFLISGVLFSFHANAQLGGLWQKAKDKASQKASDLVDKSTSPTSANNTSTAKQGSSKAGVSSVFDFAPGDSLLFSDDFCNSAVGTSLKAIKTNGTGLVVTTTAESGKWLALEGGASYKLSRQIFYPSRFTLEFDIIAVADKLDDISPVYFGFNKDNSVRDFIQSEGAYTELLYFNKDEIVVGNAGLSKYLNTTFDLTAYANRKMHISVAVEGERAAFYLDKTKIADTQIFNAGDAKNFYISGPLNYKNGAKVLIGNIKIAMFKKS